MQRSDMFAEFDGTGSEDIQLTKLIHVFSCSVFNLPAIHDNVAPGLKINLSYNAPSHLSVINSGVENECSIDDE